MNTFHEHRFPSGESMPAAPKDDKSCPKCGAGDNAHALFKEGDALIRMCHICSHTRIVFISRSKRNGEIRYNIPKPPAEKKYSVVVKICICENCQAKFTAVKARYCPACRDIRARMRAKRQSAEVRARNDD